MNFFAIIIVLSIKKIILNQFKNLYKVKRVEKNACHVFSDDFIIRLKFYIHHMKNNFPRTGSLSLFDETGRNWLS